MIKKVIMKNLICSNCAGRIEKALKDLPYIQSATFNFPNQVMLIDATDDYNEENAIPEIRSIVDSIEDGVHTYSFDKRHFMETKQEIETYYTFFIGFAIYVIGAVFEYVLSLPIAYLPLYSVGYLFIAYKIAR